LNYELILLLLLTLAAAGLLVLALVRSPAFGLGALIIATLLLPIDFAIGSARGLNFPFLIAPVLTGAWLFRMVNRRPELPWVRSSSVVPLLLLLLATTIATVLGQFKSFPTAPAPLRAQIAGACIILFSGGVFLVSAHVLRHISSLQHITYIFLFAGAFHIAPSVLPFVPRLNPSLASNAALGSLFWTWLLALSFSLALFNVQLAPRWRLALLVLVVFTLYIAFAKNRDWVSGWLPGCIALLVVAFLRYPRRTALACLLLLATALVNHDAIQTLFWTRDQQYSYLTRLEAAKVLAQLARESPVAGSGPANYYHYTPLRPILGWYVHFNSHNNYLDILLQTGLFGLFCLIWFLTSLASVAVRLQHRAPPGFARAFVAGALGGLAGTVCAAALGDWLLPFVYNVGIKGFGPSVLAWMFFGGLVAMEQVYIKRTVGDDPYECRLPV